MADTMAAARVAFSRMSNGKKNRAGLNHPQHKGRRVVPVLPATSFDELWEAVQMEEVVVLATIFGNEVEFGLYKLTKPDGGGDADDSGPVAFGGQQMAGSMTVGEMITVARGTGDPRPLPPSLRQTE